MSSSVIVPLHPGSDGDVLHVPKNGIFTQIQPRLYLEKLGQQWMEARGEARPGVQYVLDALPAGYTMWGRPRPGNPSRVDRYLFGHPEHKTFDSPNRFYPHFQHLMDNQGSNIGCPCTMCMGNSGCLPQRSSAHRTFSSLQSSSSGSSQTGDVHGQAKQAAVVPVASVQIKGRPKIIKAGMDTSKIDEEGTPDVYRSLIDQLKRHIKVDEMIEEPLSPDWKAEQKLLPGLLQDVKAKSQWHPRVGDIVLFIRKLPTGAEVVYQRETSLYQLYDSMTKQYIETPLWEAGLVGQSSSTISALGEDSEESTSVSLSGVRVEPLPNVNDVDKSISKRHKYVALRQLRPFTLWKEFLKGIPQEKWHPTIVNALTIASTASLLGKYRFKGTWPDANIYCHGIFVGFEMFTVGDTVRLLPNKIDQIECQDILVIRSIRLRLMNLDKASSNDYDEGRPYNSKIWIYGTAFTLDSTRSDKRWYSPSTPKAADQYGTWYPLHPPNKELAVPYLRILSRLYEHTSLSLCLPLSATPQDFLNAGHIGLVEAREFSVKHDERIADIDGARWYWGDSRGEALGLRTVNGLDLTPYDQERDVKDLRRGLKILDAMADDAQLPISNARASGSIGRDLRVFAAPGAAALPVRSQPEPGTRSSSSGVGGMGKPQTKRPHDTDLDVEKEMLRHTTKAIPPSEAERKKSKIMIVID